MLLAAIAVALATASAPPRTLTLEPCDVQTVRARCGAFAVPENRAQPNGRTIELRVVVVPARKRPVARDAFAYLAGGPGGGAAEQAYGLTSLFTAVNEHHDLLFVDQRGTGTSNPLTCPQPKQPLSTAAQGKAYVDACLRSVPGDMRQYGTRAAMDDLDAVRAALGYPQLDLYGASYGATAAQVFLKRHPTSVRTVVLDGATELDVSFYGRFAATSEHALDQIAKRCNASESCRKAFPHWRTRFSELVRAWDEHPARTAKNVTTTGAALAGLVQAMLLDVNDSASIPWVVAHAARGDYLPLNLQMARRNGNGDGVNRQLMYWSIWCNEPWVGLNATGSWGTDFDSYTRAAILEHRQICSLLPRRTEPASAWTLPHSNVPLLALAGGADPQDPIANLPGLKRAFPNSRAIVVPYFGHTVGQYGCLRDVVAEFVARGSARKLDTACVGAIVPPPFRLS